MMNELPDQLLAFLEAFAQNSFRVGGEVKRLTSIWSFLHKAMESRGLGFQLMRKRVSENLW